MEAQQQQASLNVIDMSCFCWETASENWVKFNPPQTHHSASRTTMPREEKEADGRCRLSSSPKIKVATFNVLADCFPLVVRLSIASGLRFPALVSAIEELDPDIIGLNEVTKTSLNLLLQSKYIRRNYYVSELANNVNNCIKPHGCVLLSKFPPSRCVKLSWGEKHRAAVAFLFPAHLFDSCGSGDVAVCSIHTIAYQTLPNRTIRREQLSTVVAALHQLTTNSVPGNDAEGRFVLMGDMNLHYKNEDGFVLENNLLDCWAECHFCEEGDNSEGITFDAAANTMIPRYIPGEKRRMRLDRILISRKFFGPSECVIWADAPVDKKKDVFLSDHFGLLAQFDTSRGTARPSETARAVMAANAQMPSEPLNFLWGSWTLSLVPHSVWLGLRALGLK